MASSHHPGVLFGLAVAVSACASTALSAPVGTGPGDLSRDLHLLRQFSRELAAMEGEMVGLQKSVGLKERGFYTQDEHAAIESLLFRYLMCRDALWEIVDAYREENAGMRMDTLTQTKGVVLGVNAALKLAYYGSKLVLTFLEEPAVVAKLNESYHRYDIPSGTYDRLFRSLTSVDHLRDLRAAWELFRDEAGNPVTQLYALSTSEAAYRELIRENYEFYDGAEQSIEEILRSRSVLLPDLRNQLRHTDVMAAVNRSRTLFQNNLYAVRGLLFSHVGRIRRPGAAELHLSEPEISRVRRMLEPGDILLTFSSGYMSNVFLPGIFKHGITYVGTPADRQRHGLSTSLFADIPDQKRSQVISHLHRDRLYDGSAADLIEAVAEGVIFNSLDHILNGRVHRVLVLRPRLNDEDRVAALKTIFLFVGADYDFRFDFNDASYLCCTEVIYRAFHNRGPINWDLVPRMGKPTLSADDIAHSCFAGTGRPFDCVALIQPGKDGKGGILSGRRGLQTFRRLMTSE